MFFTTFLWSEIFHVTSKADQYHINKNCLEKVALFSQSKIRSIGSLYMEILKPKSLFQFCFRTLYESYQTFGNRFGWKTQKNLAFSTAKLSHFCYNFRMPVKTPILKIPRTYENINYKGQLFKRSDVVTIS